MKKKRTYKRRTTPIKRKTGKSSSTTDWTWRILCTLFVISLIAVILYYTCRKEVCNVTQKVVNKTESVVVGTCKSDDNEGTIKETDNDIFSVPVYTDVEIPIWETSQPSQIIRHTGYTLSFNKHLHIPNWVAYELTRAETAGTEKRTNNFIDDPYADGICATDRDYRGSGYDKGHMAPAGDMKWSRDAMKESFYFTNICPQKPGLNRGSWKKLEETLRQWAQRDSAIVIICGPIIDPKSNNLGETKIAIPKAFFKVVAAPYLRKPRAIGFIYTNKATDITPEYYAVTVDSVEKITGMDFFSELPDNIESQIENGCNYKDWQ
ncbi:MAG: DNA/RNA non-specific endonuclease [Bacteroidales bacterium]